jgi:hypothetical protein
MGAQQRGATLRGVTLFCAGLNEKRGCQTFFTGRKTRTNCGRERVTPLRCIPRAWHSAEARCIGSVCM